MECRAHIENELNERSLDDVLIPYLSSVGTHEACLLLEHLYRLQSYRSSARAVSSESSLAVAPLSGSAGELISFDRSSADPDRPQSPDQEWRERQ